MKKMSYTALLDQENSDYDLIYNSLGLDETPAITQEMQDIKARAIADGTFMKAPNGRKSNLNEKQWLQVRTKAFKRWFGDWEKIANFVASFTDKKNILTINENEYTDDFRRIQKESRSLSEEEIQLYHRGDKKYPDESRRALGAAYERLLSRRGSNVSEFRTLTGKGNTFNVSRVNGSLFHDIFEINRNYLQNGELVDLHDSYEECKCFLSDDGLCGFAIESDGNLVSVFSLNPKNKGGFLYAIKDFIAEQGATHLDAYASNKQNLELIYAKTLGFHVASEMDYNMEYDHDNIAENHGMPKVVFMVNHEVERKAFDENSYDDASNYAKSNIKTPFAEASKVVDENGEPEVVYLGTFSRENDDIQMAMGETVKPASQMNNREVWDEVSNYAEPLGRRPITYTPVGKEQQTYTVQDGHIYNKEGKEVFKENSKDRNKILANLAIAESRAVFVNHKDSQYVVDNNQNIISVTTGNVMKWGEENGDRRAILNAAVSKFRDIIAARQQRDKAVTPQLTDQLNEIGKEVGFEVRGRKDIEDYVKEKGTDYTQQLLAGSQLTFAKNLHKPNKVYESLLSSAIMTQANTFNKLTEQLENNIGSVVKKVILFDKHAYLWSTENGYEFFIEQSIPIDEKNYDTINQLIDTYGTDTRTLGIIRDIQTLRNEKARKRRTIDTLKRAGSELYNRTNSRINGRQWLGASNRAGDNGNNLANTQGQEEFFIGKKARTQFEQQLRKARPDMSDAEIQSTLDFLHSLEDNKENTAYIKTAIRWVANRSITLPQDNTRTRQAFDVARKKHIDLQKYKTFEELITSDEMQPKEKEKATFNPDKAKTFSNKRTVITEGGREFIVYDVENTEEGQREVCKALAAHYEVSPWCLSTFTSTGEPTESAKRYWQQYNALPRKIAYENGKPVAFNSNGHVNSAYYYNGEKLNLLNEEQMKPLEKLGLVESTPFGEFILTTKGEETFENRVEEAWWDLADVSPQKSLSDNIDARASSVGTTIPFNDPFEVPEPYEPTTLEVARDHYLDDLFDGVQRTVDEVANELNINLDYVVRNYVTEHYLRTMDYSVTEVTQEMANGNGEAIAALVDQHVNIAFKNHVRQTIRAYYTEAERQIQEENRAIAARPILPDRAYEELPFFKTSQGEIYGFVAPNDDVYLDETVISPEHPIHEYTHLWDRYVAKKNSEFWKQGVKIFKQTSLWNEIENDANYGQKWKAMKGMTTNYTGL